MAEVEAKKVVLKNLAGEYLVPITEPYIAGEGIKIENNVISADIGEISGGISEAQLQNKVNIDADNLSDVGKIYISSLGMPSDKYIDLTLGASGTEYIAPANGYVAFAKKSTAGGQFIALICGSIQSNSFAVSASQNIRIFIPVKKGVSFSPAYTAGGDTIHFRFIYAEGAQ